VADVRRFSAQTSLKPGSRVKPKGFLQCRVPQRSRLSEPLAEDRTPLGAIEFRHVHDVQVQSENVARCEYPAKQMRGATLVAAQKSVYNCYGLMWVIIEGTPCTSNLVWSVARAARDTMCTVECFISERQRHAIKLGHSSRKIRGKPRLPAFWTLTLSSIKLSRQDASSQYPKPCR
jgi:hypothetical protein